MSKRQRDGWTGRGAKTIIGGRWQTAGTAAKGYGAMGWVRPDRQGKTRQAMAMSRVREDRVRWENR